MTPVQLAPSPTAGAPSGMRVLSIVGSDETRATSSASAIVTDGDAVLRHDRLHDGRQDVDDAARAHLGRARSGCSPAARRSPRRRRPSVRVNVASDCASETRATVDEDTEEDDQLQRRAAARRGRGDRSAPGLCVTTTNSTFIADTRATRRRGAGHDHAVPATERERDLNDEHSHSHPQVRPARRHRRRHAPGPLGLRRHRQEGRRRRRQRPATPAARHRDLQIMVPNAPGGGYDTTARTAAKVMEDAKITEQHPGLQPPGRRRHRRPAAHRSTRRATASSPCRWASASSARPTRRSRKATLNDTTPIAKLIEEAGAIVVPKDSPYQDINDLVDGVEGRPQEGRRRRRLVPRRPRPPAADAARQGRRHRPQDGQLRRRTTAAASCCPALLGNKIAFGASGFGEFLDQVKAGEVRVLAVTSEKRIDALPDVPTLKEPGIDLVFTNWRGIVAPPGISDADKASVDRRADEDARLAGLEGRGWRSAAGPTPSSPVTSSAPSSRSRTRAVAEILTTLGLAADRCRPRPPTQPRRCRDPGPRTVRAVRGPRPLLGVVVLRRRAARDRPHATAAATTRSGPRPVPIIARRRCCSSCAVLLAVDVARGGVGRPRRARTSTSSTGADWRTRRPARRRLRRSTPLLIEPLGWVISGAILFAGSAFALGSRHHVRGLAHRRSPSSLVTFYAFAIGLGVNLPAGVLQGVL